MYFSFEGSGSICIPFKAESRSSYPAPAEAKGGNFVGLFFVFEATFYHPNMSSLTLQNAPAKSLFDQELHTRMSGPESSPEESPLNFVYDDEECYPDACVLSHKPVRSTNTR